ncbi:hypothetical protein NA57DRAFT_72775 [Rhizodiscina lignyota]|uniref:Uncharacterized protein n=1 Tax=Rhizodiscina lignyota TaxID=1504668 RepID=A0A9P4IKH1_9PEZI|nr:hypothetical protein NA57DRAFT_72775 [Rhizodiscina lignyota]
MSIRISFPDLQSLHTESTGPWEVVTYETAGVVHLPPCNYPFDDDEDGWILLSVHPLRRDGIALVKWCTAVPSWKAVPFDTDACPKFTIDYWDERLVGKRMVEEGEESGEMVSIAALVSRREEVDAMLVEDFPDVGLAEWDAVYAWKAVV